MRYWPSVALVAVLGLVAEGYVRFEVFRGMLAIVCIVLAIYQWKILRRKQRFSLPELVLLTLLMVSVWMGLGVVRNYTYPTDSVRQMLPLYGAVVRAQRYLIWPILGGVLVVTIWTIVRVAHWLAERVS